MKDYFGSSEEVFINLCDEEFSTTIWTPFVCFVTSFVSRNNFHKVSNDERRIKTNTKLSYDIALTFLNFLNELSGTTTSDRSEVGYEFLLWHTNSIILNDDLFLVGMNLDIDMKIFTGLRGKSLFLESIRGVGE